MVINLFENTDNTLHIKYERDNDNEVVFGLYVGNIPVGALWGKNKAVRLQKEVDHMRKWDGVNAIEIDPRVAKYLKRKNIEII